MTAKAVAKKEETGITIGEFDVFDDAGAGQENVGAEDLAIPFVSIIQALSPQRSKQKSEYIEGAEEGMIFNSVTQKLIDSEEGVVVIPCGYIRNEIEWVIRDVENGGLVAVHPAGYEAPYGTQKDDRGRDRVLDENGNMTNNQIVTTGSFYVLVLTEEGAEPCVINMSSTQLKKAKRWNSLIKQHTGIDPRDNMRKQLPSFLFTYKLTTVPESNNKGNWFGWQIEDMGQVHQQDLYQMAKDFYASINKGEVKASYEGDDAAADGEVIPESPEESF